MFLVSIKEIIESELCGAQVDEGDDCCIESKSGQNTEDNHEKQKRLILG